MPGMLCSYVCVYVSFRYFGRPAKNDMRNVKIPAFPRPRLPFVVRPLFRTITANDGRQPAAEKCPGLARSIKRFLGSIYQPVEIKCLTFNVCQ